jgi:hypothetical protein
LATNDQANRHQDGEPFKAHRRPPRGFECAPRAQVN